MVPFKNWRDSLKSIILVKEKGMPRNYSSFISGSCSFIFWEAVSCFIIKDLEVYIYYFSNICLYIFMVFWQLNIKLT